MHIKNQKDFYAGLIFIGAGIAFGWGATNYRFGTSAHMGPGYFPLVCSVLLALIGVIVCSRALWVGVPGGNPVGRWAFRPLLTITLANVLFGVLLAGWPLLHIPAFGFVVATLVLIVVAARAGTQFRIREVGILAVVLTLGSWLVFVWMLHMQFLSWPEFLAA